MTRDFLEHCRVFPLRTLGSAGQTRVLCPKASHRRRHATPSNARRKLDVCDVLEIRRVAHEQPTCEAWAQARALAPTYGVSVSTVFEVITRRTWVRMPAESRRWVSSPSFFDRCVLRLMLILWMLRELQPITRTAQIVGVAGR